MRHHSIVGILSRLRPIRLRRPLGDTAAGNDRSAKTSLLDYLLRVDPRATEPSTADVLSRLMPDAIGRHPELAISTAGPAAMSPRHAFVEESSWAAPFAATVAPGAGSDWLGLDSRSDARQLRAVDRAIAEIAGRRRRR